MASAGHPVKVEVGTDGVSYNEVDGISSYKGTITRELLETTDFKDTSGARTFLAGLKDGSIDLSGMLEEADANGQAILRTAFDGGTDLYVRVTFNPSAGVGLKGYAVKTLVESHEYSSEVDGLNEWSASLQFNGAPAAY